MYYATIGAILVEPQSWHVFIGLSAMTKADGTLKRVFEWCELPATYARHTVPGSGGFSSAELLFSCLRGVKFTG